MSIQVTLKIERKGAEPEAASFPQSYPLEVADDATVLDAMLQARDEQDGSLGFRAGCLRGFCGDCAYEVSGDGVLACMTPVTKAAKGGEITVGPVDHVGVSKDLVYDMDTFLWDKVKAVEPWVSSVDGVPSEERLMDPAIVEDLQTVMSCVMCGLCDEGCTVIAVDSTFLGPAALTKAYRTVKDPRGGGVRERFQVLDRPHGVWDCTHCFEANGHCPKKGINPSTRIIAMRDMLIKEGIRNKPIARHHDSFAASVKSSGWLDEGRIAVESVGWTNIPGLFKLLQVGFRAVRRGKAPVPYLHKKRPGAEHIKRIFEKVERTRR